jgi:phage terminase large subunit
MKGVRQTASMESMVAVRLEHQAALARAGSYPLTKYAKDPVRYAKERLGVDLMEHQKEIARALCDAIHGLDGGAYDKKARRIVAVRSGQKSGKSLVAAVLVLWFYECFEAARVLVCMSVIKQMDMVIWREVASLIHHARKNGRDIDAKRKGGGFASSDGLRSIETLMGRDIESLAGVSGPQLMVCDEASSLEDTKLEVFEGNQMGGGFHATLMISNPTRTIGPFYDCFHAKKERTRCFHINGEDVARTLEACGRVIPYVVTQEKIESARERDPMGIESPFYQVRVLGNFLRNEVGKCISMGKIEDAALRWTSREEDGPLVIGYDVAGSGTGGDSHAWAPVRGTRCEPIVTKVGLDERAAVRETLALLAEWRREGEIPHIHVDAEGPIGSVIFALLHLEQEKRDAGHDKAGAFVVLAYRGSDKRVRDRQKFERLRDEMIWNLAAWMTTGAIPPDNQLHQELHAPRWTENSANYQKATPKDVLRDMLGGRSPDRFDALCLAVQPPPLWLQDEDPAPVPRREAPDREERMTPYEGGAYTGELSPYGGNW